MCLLTEKIKRLNSIIIAIPNSNIASHDNLICVGRKMNIARIAIAIGINCKAKNEPLQSIHIKIPVNSMKISILPNFNLLPHFMDFETVAMCNHYQKVYLYINAARSQIKGNLSQYDCCISTLFVI